MHPSTYKIYTYIHRYLEQPCVVSLKKTRLRLLVYSRTSPHETSHFLLVRFKKADGMPSLLNGGGPTGAVPGETEDKHEKESG
jgi:hypothetical protein